MHDSGMVLDRFRHIAPLYKSYLCLTTLKLLPMPFIRYIPCVVVALLAAIACIGVSAQESFRNYGVVDGLSSGFVMSATENSRGFVWIATEEGLVWLGTDAGAALFIPRSREIIPFVHSASDSGSITPGRVRSIRQMADGEIWFGTAPGGVCILDARSYTYSDIRRARFRKLPVNASAAGPSSTFVRTIFQDSFGNIWLGNYRSGVDVSNHLSERFGRIEYMGQSRYGEFYKPAWSCVCSGEGVMWVGGENEIARIDNGAVTTVQLPGRSSRTMVRALAVDSSGRLWIGTTDIGAFIYRPEKNSLRRWKVCLSMWPVSVSTTVPCGQPPRKDCM